MQCSRLDMRWTCLCSGQIFLLSYGKYSVHVKSYGDGWEICQFIIMSAAGSKEETKVSIEIICQVLLNEVEQRKVVKICTNAQTAFHWAYVN